MVQLWRVDTIIIEKDCFSLLQFSGKEGEGGWKLVTLCSVHTGFGHVSHGTWMGFVAESVLRALARLLVIEQYERRRQTRKLVVLFKDWAAEVFQHLVHRRSASTLCVFPSNVRLVYTHLLVYVRCRHTFWCIHTPSGVYTPSGVHTPSGIYIHRLVYVWCIHTVWCTHTFWCIHTPSGVCLVYTHTV